MYQAGTLTPQDSGLVYNSVIPGTRFRGLDQKTSVVFAGSIQEFLNLVGVFAPPTSIRFDYFRCIYAYKLVAADWEAGLAIPLDIRPGSAFIPIWDGVVLDYQTIIYNAAVEAYINGCVRLVKPALFSGNFGFSNNPQIQLLTGESGGAGGNVNTTVFVKYDYDFTAL